MPEPHSSAASGVALGIKSGFFVGLFALGVSVMTVAVGFTVIPPTPGKELQDVARRLACGLLCSFILGPLVAHWALNAAPWLLTPWETLFSDPVIARVAAYSPFLALTALPGFWIVAAGMRWFERRKDKDLQELIKDAKS